MNQQVQEELIKMWLNRPEYLKEAQRVISEEEKLGEFMVIPMKGECCIKILIGDFVLQASIQLAGKADFIRGDIKRIQGKDVFIKEAVCKISKYDLKFGIYYPKQQSSVKKTAEQKVSIAKSVGNILLKMFEEQMQANQKGRIVSE